MIERSKFLNNFDQLGGPSSQMEMGDEAKTHEECSRFDEEDGQEQVEIKEKASMRRGLRDSVMKQQLTKGKAPLCRSNSMLQELKEIQEEKKLKRQQTCENNFLNKTDSPYSTISKNNLNTCNINEFSYKLSTPIDGLSSSFGERIHPASDCVEQLYDRKPASETKIQCFSDNSQNEQFQAGNDADKIGFNMSEIHNQKFQIPSITINDNTNNNDSPTKPDRSSKSSPFDSPTPRKLNFIHKQVKGVLEQEGYIIEYNGGFQQLNQLSLLESQRQMVKQASLEYDSSMDHSMNDEIDEKDSSFNENKTKTDNNKEQNNPLELEKENKQDNSSNYYLQDKTKSHGYQANYLATSERNIPRQNEGEDVLDRIVDRRNTESNKSDRRNLLRQNVLLTKAIIKTPTNSTQDGISNWGALNIEIHEDVQPISSKNDSDTEKRSIKEGQEVNSNNDTSSIDKYFFKDSAQLDKINLKKVSSSSSLSSSSEELIEKTSYNESNKANCGGESTRNHRMRMNIGWGQVKQGKQNNSSEGDDEEDNKSDNQPNPKNPRKLSSKYKTFSKHNTIDIEQEEEKLEVASVQKEKVERINFNFSDEPMYSRNESYGDDEEEDKSDDYTTKSENSDQKSKFQKYFTQNNNFQFDSIEEMQSSQESIKKSSTKNSQKTKYPNTTRAIPRTDNPSSFYQYINMRKSKRQKSNIAESQSDLQQEQSYANSPEYNVSGCVEGFNESIIDFNINLDQSQSLRVSKCLSPTHSPSKQSSNSGTFHFNLNQVKSDNLSSSPSTTLAQQPISEINSPKFKYENGEESKQDQTFSSEIPQRDHLQSNPALLKNYLQDNSRKEINEKTTINTTSTSCTTATTNTQKTYEQSNQYQNTISPFLSSNEQKQADQQSSTNNYNKINLESIQNYTNQPISSAASQSNENPYLTQQFSYKYLQSAIYTPNITTTTPQSPASLNIPLNNKDDINLISNDINYSNQNFNWKNNDIQNTDKLYQQSNFRNQQIQIPINPYNSSSVMNNSPMNMNKSPANMNNSPMNINNNITNQTNQHSIVHNDTLNSGLPANLNYNPSPHNSPSIQTNIQQNYPITQFNKQNNNQIQANSPFALYQNLSSPMNNISAYNPSTISPLTPENKLGNYPLTITNSMITNFPSSIPMSELYYPQITQNTQNNSNKNNSDNNYFQDQNQNKDEDYKDEGQIKSNDNYTYKNKPSVECQRYIKADDSIYPKNDLVYEESIKRSATNTSINQKSTSVNYYSDQNIENVISAGNTSHTSIQSPVLLNNYSNLLNNKTQLTEIYSPSTENNNHSNNLYAYQNSRINQNNISITLYPAVQDNKQNDISPLSTLSQPPNYLTFQQSQTAQYSPFNSINNFNMNTSLNNQADHTEIERSKLIEKILQEFRNKTSITTNSSQNQINVEQNNTSTINNNILNIPLAISKNNSFVGISQKNPDIIQGLVLNSSNSNFHCDTSLNSYSQNNNNINNIEGKNFIQNQNSMLNASPIASYTNIFTSPLTSKLTSNYDLGFTECGERFNGQQLLENKGSNVQSLTNENMKNGYKTIIYPDNSSFVGTFYCDKKTGFGKEYDKLNNLIYQGDYQDDKYHGIGTLNNFQPTSSTVSCENLSQIDNSWLQYSGQFSQGIKQGKGKLKLQNNDIFDGYFISDKPSGYGEYTYSSGKLVRGIWNNGILQVND